MNFLNKIAYLIFAAAILTSCGGSDDSTDIPEEEEEVAAYQTGVLITNEGPFGTGTGTVSFISEDLTLAENGIYQTVNNLELGNVVQSLGFNATDAYIVANNSNKITVVNRFNFEGRAIIENGLENPRYFIAAGGKGYVTNWGDPFNNNDDYIVIIDLVDLEVIGNIPVPFGPEQMVTRAGKVYVAHQGGFDYNNVITVINTDTDAIEATVEVGDVPNSMVFSGSNLYVLCGGKPEFTGDETNGSLYRVALAGSTVLGNMDMELTQHPNNLTIDGDQLFYALDGKVFEMNADATAFPTDGILNGFFYGLTAHNGLLYATDAGDFASDGTLKIFDLANNSEIESHTVGIIPRGVYFND